MKLTIALTLITLMLTTLAALAQGVTSNDFSSEEIVQALNPNKSVKMRSLRGIQVAPLEHTSPPSIDLTINFGHDSSQLGGEEMLILKRLGTALKDLRLANYRFLIAGHTDSKGSIEYNRHLSEARAKAAREHLIFVYDIEPSRLEAVGHGKTKPIKPDAPDDPANRRVQIINLGTVTTSREITEN